MAKAKKIRELDGHAPAAQGIRLVFITRFNELIEWRKTALDWSDPEGVHSMRVASRRLRSAMRDFLPYLPKRSLTPLVKQLKGLADALGGVRDQDVAIEALERIEKKAPAEHSAALKRLIEKRKQLRDQQRKKLKAAVAKSELKKLETHFAAAVDDATAAAERKNKRSTTATFAEVSQSVIRDRLKEFEKRSDGLFNPLDVEALHALRIATKRLRYAIELLAPSFDRSIAAHAERAARLQTTLGELHDCDSWIISLGGEIARARKVKAEAQVATFVWLLDHFTHLRAKHLHHAFNRWSEWETDEVRAQLRAAVVKKTPAVAEEFEVTDKPALTEEPESQETLDQVMSEPSDQVAGEQMRQAL